MSAIFLQIQFEKSIAMSAPVVISLVEIVEKGQPSLAGMFSPPRNSSLNFSQLQLQLSHDIQSWLGEKVARIVFICIHSPVGRGAGGGGVQSHHHNLNALDAQTPPVTTDEKIFPTVLGSRPSQGRDMCGLSQSYWPVRCLLSHQICPALPRLCPELGQLI